MNEHSQPRAANPLAPLFQLILARVREFYRQPEAIFWVYGFPILIVIALGYAFRSKPVDKLTVDVQQGPSEQRIVDDLEKAGKFKPSIHDAGECRLRLRTGKTDLVVVPSQTKYEYQYDPTRPESILARDSVDDALQKAKGRINPIATGDYTEMEPGGRYIDFLIPGLLGMSLMGGGLWGVGYVTVDMRIRKLLKRFLATPMRKSHFLAAIMLSRLLFLLPEMVVIIGFGWLSFGVGVQGSLWTVLVLVLVGAFTFSGIGLLVASRARTLEAVSGLMNLVMLPMWVLSGIFFNSERFPDAVQPIIKALPLTPLNEALRAVFLQGASLFDLGPQLAILAAWGSVTFALALRWFRWV